jgi:hypothetical protein
VQVYGVRPEMKMIEQAYLVSVLELREICRDLTNDKYGSGGKFEYRLLRPNHRQVMIRFNDDPTNLMNLNTLCFGFPIVAHVRGLARLHRNLEAGHMVCLSAYTAETKQYGLYEDEGDLKHNEAFDWERFWLPLAAILQKEYESL